MIKYAFIEGVKLLNNILFFKLCFFLPFYGKQIFYIFDTNLQETQDIFTSNLPSTKYICIKPVYVVSLEGKIDANIFCRRKI